MTIECSLKAYWSPWMTSEYVLAWTEDGMQNRWGLNQKDDATADCWFCKCSTTLYCKDYNLQ